MDQRSDYLIQVLEKIGVPLVSAISEVSARQSKGAAKAPDQNQLAQQDARKIAELLARAVQVSIDIGKSIDLSAMEDQGESMRLALAALASDVVGAQYRHLGRAPAEGDLKRISMALQAVLTFSENFTPSPEILSRLKELKATGAPADAEQIAVQYIQAFVPVINAIASYSFGQPEKKLIQDVSDRLTSRAASMRQQLVSAKLADNSQKLSELALLRALAALYAQCHESETQRLMVMDEAARANQTLSLDPVWDAFDVRAAMLEVLAPAFLGQNTAAAGSTGSAAPKAPQPAPPQTPAPKQPATPETPPATGASPLSMFAKPKDDAAPQQTPPTEQPPQPTAPPAAPPEQPPETPPKDEENKDSGSQGGSGGGPMSFFKKPT